MELGQYRSGYQYAAGALLCREKTPEQIGNEARRYALDPFYEGMADALRDYLGAFDGIEYGPSGAWGKYGGSAFI